MLPALADARPNMGQLFDPLHHQKPAESSLLDRYRIGWSEADPDKILDATAPGYRFRDPFVGTFSRQSLHAYFDLLQDRLSRAGTIRRPDIGFVLSGPMDHPSYPSEIQFWREAPKIGLTGDSRIKIGERGVIAESVTYDLNLASDMLCRALQ
jgi:hypothetical protein